jgi:hypothetical protein
MKRAVGIPKDISGKEDCKCRGRWLNGCNTGSEMSLQIVLDLHN